LNDRGTKRSCAHQVPTAIPRKWLKAVPDLRQTRYLCLACPHRTSIKPQMKRQPAAVLRRIWEVVSDGVAADYQT